MSDTIELGIDLGRSKSRAAICEGGEASVLRNNDGSDATPSAIWMPRANLAVTGVPYRYVTPKAMPSAPSTS